MWLHRIKLFSSPVHVCCVCWMRIRRMGTLPRSGRSLDMNTFVRVERAWVQHHRWCIKTLLPCSTLFFSCSMGERLLALCLLTFYSPYSQCALEIGRFIIMTILLSSTSTNIMLLWLSLFSISLALYGSKSVSCCRYLDGPGHQFVIINIYNFGFGCRWIWAGFWIWMFVARFAALWLGLLALFSLFFLLIERICFLCLSAPLLRRHLFSFKIFSFRKPTFLSLIESLWQTLKTPFQPNQMWIGQYQCSFFFKSSKSLFTNSSDLWLIFLWFGLSPFFLSLFPWHYYPIANSSLASIWWYHKLLMEL